MYISSITTAGVATAVWGQATRQLTSFGSGLMAPFSQAQTTLAASASLDLRPSATKFREITIAAQAGAAGSLEWDLFDGSNAKAVGSDASGAQGGASFNGNNTVGPRLKNNDASNAATYLYAGTDWIQ